MPRLTICIPTYNRSDLLPASVETILSQTYRDFDLVIVDNASTDNTEAVVRAMKDPRIRYVRNSRNVGIVPNHNRCYREAKTELVGIYHDHDLYHPELVERLIELLDRYPRVGFAFSAAHVVSYTDPNRIIRAIAPQWTEMTEGHKVRRHLLRHWRSPIVAPTVIARRACFDQVGVYDESLLINADRELWIRVLRHWDVGYVSTPLVKMREPETPVMMTTARAQAIWDSLAVHVATQEKHIQFEYADAPLRLWAERCYLTIQSFAQYWAHAAWGLANNKTELINLGPKAFSRMGMPISAAILQVLRGSRGSGQMIAKVARGMRFLRRTQQ